MSNIGHGQHKGKNYQKLHFSSHVLNFYLIDAILIVNDQKYLIWGIYFTTRVLYYIFVWLKEMILKYMFWNSNLSRLCARFRLHQPTSGGEITNSFFIATLVLTGFKYYTLYTNFSLIFPAIKIISAYYLPLLIVYVY